MERPRVVVVGGGFAGLAAVRSLGDADVDVLLLDRDANSTFQPLLYQVATGGLNPGDVTYSLRAVHSRHPNTRFRRAHVTGLDPGARRVRTAAGDDVVYDYLILCGGVSTNFAGVPGAAEHARGMYSRTEAEELRDLLYASFEAVAQGVPGATEPVVVVVGGGATGVELAGTLAELRNVTAAVLYPELDAERIRIVLVEMTDEVLGSFAPRLRAYAARELRARGVELRLATSVTEVRRDGVVLGDGEVLPSVVTVWASGVKVRDEVSAWRLPQGPGGRIRVGADLRVVDPPEIFAVGDIAAPERGALPQLAQPALQGGDHAGRQIRRLLAGEPTEPFRYHDRGMMATIGRRAAVLELPNGLTMRGRLAWFGWLVLHLAMLMGNRNRLASLANLSVRYFSWPRFDAIVGDPPSTAVERRPAGTPPSGE